MEKKKTGFQRIVQIVIIIMLVLTLAGVVLGALTAIY
ncbi:MAG: DUF4044 domain-containing protein [Lactobacillales bacterium]|jgi:hypothetical protein|nr:DUF4044 domain-containing protein [Lactobacillales bacterium]